MPGFNQDYLVPAGHTIAVSVFDGSAHIQRLDNPAIAATVTNGAPATFGPYMIPRTFRVQQSAGATVTVADADPSANIPTTAQKALLTGIPTADQDDSVSVWNDAGALKVSSAP